jgi:ATP-dependent helicase/nuclease subunit B
MAFLICNNSFRELYGKIELAKYIEVNIEQKTLENSLFVAATNRLALHFEFELVDKYFERHHIPATNLFVTNLDGIIRRAFSYFVQKGNNKILSDAYRFLLFYEAFENSDLGFFKQKNSSQKQPFYVVKWLSNIIFGLKEDGITPEKLREELVSSNPNITNSPKFKDTFLLFEYYQKLLETNQLFDVTDAINLATQKLLQYFDEKGNIEGRPIYLPFIPAGQAIILFEFFDFKIPEIEFLTALGKFSNPVGIYLDFDENNGPLFGNFIDLVLAFKNRGFLTISIPESVDFATEQKPSIFLKKYLFNNFKHKVMPRLSDFIKIIETENRFAEAKEIARLCNYLIQVRNFKPSEICIVTKNPSKYVPIFREVFAIEQVPVNITERFKLSTSPLVISILAVLDVVAKNFRFQDLRKALQSFYFRFETIDETTGETCSVNIDNFLEAAIRMKLIGGFGKEYYLIRFANRIDSLKTRLQQLQQTLNPDEMEIQETSYILNLFIKAERTLKVLLSYFDFHNGKYTIKEFQDLVERRIIKRFGVYAVLKQVIDKALTEVRFMDIASRISRFEEIERDSRALACFLKVLDEFTFIHSQRFGNRKFSLDELVELLKVTIYDEKFQISRKPNYGVTITTIEQTRGVPFKVMILCGAVDGEIPNRYNPEQFLGKKLGRTERRHFENERLEFYYFLANAPMLLDNMEKLIYIFYPKSDAKKEFVRSPFINYLLDIIGLPEKEVCYKIPYTHFAAPSDLDLEWRQYFTTQELKAMREFGQGAINGSLSHKHYGIPFLDRYDFNRFNHLELTNSTKSLLDSLTKEPISVSFLEDYRKCPYKFFVSRILKVWQPISEIEIFLNNLEKGQILHSIASNFYKDLVKQQLASGITDFTLSIDDAKFAPAFLDVSEKKQYEQQIERITLQILSNFESFANFFEVDKERFIGTTGERSGYIRQWLNYELQRRDLCYLPTIFELGFGFRHHNSLPPIPVFSENGVELFRFRGKIDRIDICETTDETTGDKQVEALIIDYKLTESECKNKNTVMKGESFQMPFYAYALRYIFQNYIKANLSKISLAYQIFDFKKKPNSNKKDYLWNYKIFYIAPNSILSKEVSKPTGRAIGEKEAEDNRGEIQKTNGEDKLDELINVAIINSKDIIQSVTQKMDFPVKPEGRICDYCDYSTICKIKRY